MAISLRWRHNGHDSVSNHQPHDCLLNRLFRRRSKKTSKLRVTGLRVGKSPGTGEFPAQMASNAENVSIWWRHHDNSVTEKLLYIECQLQRHWIEARDIIAEQKDLQWKTICGVFCWSQSPWLFIFHYSIRIPGWLLKSHNLTNAPGWG